MSVRRLPAIILALLSAALAAALVPSWRLPWLAFAVPPARVQLQAAHAPERDVRLYQPPRTRASSTVSLGLADPQAESLLLWIASGDHGAYQRTTVHLVGRTRRFRVWGDDASVPYHQAMLVAAERADQAANEGHLAALWRAASASIQLPVDVVFASMTAQGGYFSSADQPKSAPLAYSNHRQAIYIATSYCGQDGCSPGIIAHELQHLLQFQVNPQQESWINEGLSVLAESLPEPSTPTESAVLPCTNFPLLRWSDGDGDAGPHYEGSASFFRFWRQSQGEAALERVALSGTPDLAGLQAVLSGQGSGLSFDGIFLSWAAHEASLRLREGPPSVADSGRCDLPSYQSLLTGELDGAVAQYGSQLIRLPADGPLAVSFHGERLAPVVPVAPHSGHAFWWLNRLSQSDASLTRLLDLRHVSSAHLSYWAWYDIEQDYDWGYVAVSDDGGRSWHLLSGDGMTSDDPYGTNPGVGFTGKSQGWVQREVDLSDFAGRLVLLRLGVMTDDAVEHPGLCLDDLSVPEIGFYDAAEAWNGWQAQGFALLSTEEPLEQRYAVQALFVGPAGVQAWNMPLDRDNTGRWQLPAAKPGEMRALLVSALSAEASAPAPYRLSVANADRGG